MFLDEPVMVFQRNSFFSVAEEKKVVSLGSFKSSLFICKICSTINFCMLEAKLSLC